MPFKDPAARREYIQRWRAENPDRVRAYCRRGCKRYYDKNREAMKQRARDYHAAHPDETKRQLDEWRKAHPERVRESYREWCRANPLKMKARDLRRRARRANAAGKCTAEQLQARIDYYGGRCWMCGGVADTIDHVIPLAKGGSHWPANLRPACRPCNSSKKDRVVVSSRAGAPR